MITFILIAIAYVVWLGVILGVIYISRTMRDEPEGDDYDH